MVNQNQKSSSRRTKIQPHQARLESMLREMAILKAEMDASHRNIEALGRHTDENIAKMRAMLGES